jgi:hypothetical protein
MSKNIFNKNRRESSTATAGLLFMTTAAAATTTTTFDDVNDAPLRLDPQPWCNSILTGTKVLQ